MAARRSASVAALPTAGHWAIRSVYFLGGQAVPTKDGTLPAMVTADKDTSIKRDGEILLIERAKTNSGKPQRVEIHCSNVAIDSEWVE